MHDFIIFVLHKAQCKLRHWVTALNLNHFFIFCVHVSAPRYMNSKSTNLCQFPPLILLMMLHFWGNKIFFWGKMSAVRRFWEMLRVLFHLNDQIFFPWLSLVSRSVCSIVFCQISLYQRVVVVACYNVMFKMLCEYTVCNWHVIFLVSWPWFAQTPWCDYATSFKNGFYKHAKIAWWSTFNTLLCRWIDGALPLVCLTSCVSYCWQFSKFLDQF